MQNNIPFYWCSTICWVICSISQFLGISEYIQAQYIYIHFCCGAGHIKSWCDFRSNCQTIRQRGCANLNFHWQYMDNSIALPPISYWYCQGCYYSIHLSIHIYLNIYHLSMYLPIIYISNIYHLHIVHTGIFVVIFHNLNLPFSKSWRHWVYCHVPIYNPYLYMSCLSSYYWVVRIL